MACEDTNFQTGSYGIRLRLAIELAGSGSRRAPLRITDPIALGERTKWKMRELCRRTGLRFDPPCEASGLVGKRGRARFEVDPRDGLITFRVGTDLAARAQGAR